MGDNNKDTNKDSNKDSFSSVVDSLLKGMNSVLSTRTVVGEPTKLGDTIILPLVDVTFGIGAGAGNSDKKNSGAGGIGGKMSPSAVLIIDKGVSKLVNVRNQDAVTKILDMVPDVVDKFVSTPEKRAMDKELEKKAVSKAFPEGDGSEVTEDYE